MCTYKWAHFSVNTSTVQIIFKFSTNINDMCVIKLHLFCFKYNKKLLKKGERKIQIYGKIKVHIFSYTLKETKLDRIYHKNEVNIQIFLSQILQRHPCPIVHVNLVAGMFPRTVQYGKTMASH